MAKRKKKVRKGNYFSRVQRSPKVRKVKAKIRKQKSVLKRLSAEYRRALKKVK